MEKLNGRQMYKRIIVLNFEAPALAVLAVGLEPISKSGCSVTPLGNSVT